VQRPAACNRLLGWGPGTRYPCLVPHDYLVTSVPGLEDVTVREVSETLEGTVLEARRGKIRFLSEEEPRTLARLRSAEHLHVRLGEFTLGSDPEETVYETLRGLDLAPYLEAMSRLVDLPARPSFRITGQREGDHPFTSEDVARWAGQALVDRHGWPVDLEGWDLNVVVRVEGDEAWIGGRLSRVAGRRRPWAVRKHRAGLNPLIAYCMVRLAEPRPGERALDPFCGGGTLPIEGTLWEPEVRWSGSDRDPRALAMAQENAAAAGVGLDLARANTRRLPLRTASVDLVISNLPFGQRSGSHGRNRRVYVPSFTEIARVLRPGGRALVLTLERRLMEMVLKRTPLEVVSSRVVSHGGLLPRIYHLRPA